MTAWHLSLFLLLNGRRLQEQYRKRRQRQRERMRTTLGGYRRRLDAAQISDSAAAVDSGVAIQPLAPEAAVRCADHVIVTRNRREIAHNDHGCSGTRLAQEAQD